MKDNLNLKTIAFSLGLAAMTLSATEMSAQGRPGGMFGTTNETHETSGMLRSTTITGGGDDITNADFGEEAPLGSGIAILIGAGLGYVALKKKED